MNVLRNPLSRLRMRHLQLLELLLRAGTARKVAEQLHVSPPAVTQMLKEIETAFGGALFERSPSGLVPNERLRVLVRRSQAALGEIVAADRELSRGSVARQTLRLGASLLVLMDLMPHVVSLLRERSPGLRISLHEHPVSEMLEMLDTGLLDGVFGRLPPKYFKLKVSQVLDYWPVYPAEMCLVVGPRHPLAGRRRVTVADLVDREWALGVAEGQSQELIGQVFLAAGLPVPDPVVECRPFIANLALVAETELIAITSRTEALRWQRQGAARILPIDFKLDLPPVAFYWRKTVSDSPLVIMARQAVYEAALRVGVRRPPRCATGRSK